MPTALRKELFADVDGDGRGMIRIYDVCVGDAVKIGAFASVRREADGSYSVLANAPYRLNAP